MGNKSLPSIGNEPRPQSVQDVRKLLYRKFRVTLISGRVLEGDFTCLDRQGNIILSNTFEQVTTASGRREERHMGLVLIPIAQQRKIELQATIDEEMSMLKLVEHYAASPREDQVVLVMERDTALAHRDSFA